MKLTADKAVLQLSGIQAALPHKDSKCQMPKYSTVLSLDGQSGAPAHAWMIATKFYVPLRLGFDVNK